MTLLRGYDRRRDTLGFNMTPMIDVVFLLIIFFLVSSHLAQRENRIPVTLPSAASGQADASVDLPRVTLTLRDDGSLWLAGRPIEISDMMTHLVERRRQFGEALEVRIRCDRSVVYGQVEPILATAARAEIWNVTFAVMHRQER